MEAEGDPTVFDMSVRVMRPDTGPMMQLVKYNLAEEGADPEGAVASVVHNHYLKTNNLTDLD